MNEDFKLDRGPLDHDLVTLRILMVVDGRIDFSHGQYDFGLGFVIDTLRAGWSREVRISVALATREPAIDVGQSGGFDVLYSGFRFDQPGFRINDWDQVWIFADQPSNSEGDGSASDELIAQHSLGDEEAKVLAEWMDRGGGLFATGDHNNLGASVCHRIPRVRTMRKWRIADGTPSRDGERRNQTLQSPEYDEGDADLQPLDLVYWQSVRTWPFQIIDRPHPILCAPTGPIDRFPDHMHEGELVADANVQLNLPLGIPNYERLEYPRAVPLVAERKFGIPATIPWRPRPAIIAYGKTTNAAHFALPDELRTAALVANSQSGYKRFGVVSVYDGEGAGVGRVVCDSTWHHWLSSNLHGLSEDDRAAYGKMQRYYRNVALWLANRPVRNRTLTASVWNTLAHSAPMEFTADQSHWEMGQRVLERVSRTWGPCWVNELVASQFEAEGLYRFAEPRRDEHGPAWNRLPEELVNKAVVGSLAKALYPLLNRLRTERTRGGEVRVDPQAVEKLAAAGLAQVHALLTDTLADAVRSLGDLARTLDVLAGKPQSGGD